MSVRQKDNRIRGRKRWKKTQEEEEEEDEGIIRRAFPVTNKNLCSKSTEIVALRETERAVLSEVKGQCN